MVRARQEVTPRGSSEDRVLVLAPVGRDGPLIKQALREEGTNACLCQSADGLCGELREGAALLVLTTEVLQDGELPCLRAFLDKQPPWSDLPILLLTGSNDSGDIAAEVMPTLGNVTILERPLRLSSLRSVVRAALRARKRQYEVRGLIQQAQQARQEAERQQSEIEALNKHLRQAMRETHHRVKNNLQIISAMVDMHLLDGSRTVTVEELQRLGRSVRTLAAIHDILTHQAHQDGQAQYVSARDILEKLLPMLQDMALNRRIHYDIEDARVSARQGTSLALVVNELVSNSLKYGCGDVLIRFKVLETGALLEICDDGPGFPPDFDPTAAARTGLELVENLSRWDLDGEVRFLNRLEGGACVAIRIPWARRNDYALRDSLMASEAFAPSLSLGDDLSDGMSP